MLTNVVLGRVVNAGQMSQSKNHTPARIENPSPEWTLVRRQSFSASQSRSSMLSRPKMEKRSYTLTPLGQVFLDDGKLNIESTIDATMVSVPHLCPHVEEFGLNNSESVKCLIRYSSHCWTYSVELAQSIPRFIFLDGTRQRVFDPIRYGASHYLRELICSLPQNRIYVTQSDRNYGCYNATVTSDEGCYTAYFTLRPRKGRFDGVRHKFLLTVESAYSKPQQEPGMKTSLSAIIGKARENKTVKYRKP
ncbi:hypothetical protein C0081_16720 [Cohaesibacter celericrescens]|uniref:Uncharacterized protein n=1 Tax=Cohaesibacter celericrescens TaxID=2067669 RepID=A0A2N5XNP6_9HYPH|nr:hypothetical protein C0081_16720 [Cohaesibacter celericrescens]